MIAREYMQVCHNWQPRSTYTMYGVFYTNIPKVGGTWQEFDGFASN